MSNRPLLALGSILAVVAFAACGDADSGQSLRGGGPGAVPDDPSEQPGAPEDPDSTANPNANAPPTKPTTPGTTGQVELALSTATPAADLGTTLDVTVTVTAKGGYTGPAALTATGLPTGVTATFVPASVTAGAAPVTAKMTLDIPYTTIPSAAGASSAIVVHAAAGGAEATANANFKVNPKVTLTVPVNATALLAAGGGGKQLDTWGGPTFGANATPLQTQAGNGITFIVKNLDSAPRTIHGQNGFAHGSAAIPPGGTDTKVRVLDPANANINSSGYLHGVGNGTAVGFKVIVNKAP